MLGFCSLVWIKYGPTKERYDLNAYFGIQSESELGITINNDVMDMRKEVMKLGGDYRGYSKTHRK